MYYLINKSFACLLSDNFTPYANSYAVMMNACEKLCKWYFVIEKTPRKCMKLDEYVLFLWRACASACCVIL